MAKPLGGKAYGSIAHLPGSRLGPGENHVTEHQAAVLTERTRSKLDTVIVTEKLDGSCTAVAKLNNGSIVALGRAGHLAATSPYEQHQLFAAWVDERRSLFATILQPGERLVGEWLAQVHGTRYALPDDEHRPWYVFDLMRGAERATQAELRERIDGSHICIPRMIGLGPALAIDEGMRRCAEWSMAHPDDGDEGLVYRLETSKNAGSRYVAYLAKYVRPDKEDGKYLYGADPLWNWHPTKPRWWEVG